jgi:hypothetical protein
VKPEAKETDYPLTAVVKTFIWLLEQKYCRCSTAERIFLRKKTVGDLVLWEFPSAYLVNLHIFSSLLSFSKIFTAVISSSSTCLFTQFNLEFQHIPFD